MTSIIPFEFDGQPVRTALIDGEVLLVGKDVAERLGYANPADALAKHCKGVAKRYPLKTNGGTQEVRFIGEADMLRLIINSKLPAAEKFERWVFEEVLPSIRKTGGYMVAAPDETPEELALRALQVLQATVERQKAQLAKALPKAAIADRIAESDGAVNLTIAAKTLQTQPRRLINFLSDKKYIRRDHQRHWIAFQRPIEAGYLLQKTHTVNRENGRTRCYPQVLVTPRGIAHLAGLINQTSFGRRLTK